MPLLADRVRETTTTVGTGAVSLGGAVTGFQAFNTAFANGATVYYVIQYNTEWEIGIGTVGTGTLSRDTVLQSSNADALVPFSAGVKDVFCSYVADRAVTTSDAATLTNKTIEDYTNNVAANSTHFRIKATGTIAKGAVVKATGFNPGEQAIEVAVVTSATDLALGIAEAALTTGQFGLAVVIGELFDINTNGFTVGAVIYSNGSGGYTETKPSSGTYQPLGWVVRSNSSNGVIAVNIVAPLYVETSTATSNTVVLRDGSGNFSAGTITATLNGAAPAGSLTGTTLASNVVTSSLTSVGTLSSLTVSGNLTVDTNTIFVDSTNNRVGIGTATPLTALHVAGNSTTTGPVLRLANDNDAIDANGTLGSIEFYSGDDSGFGDAVQASITAIQPATTPVSGVLTFNTATSGTLAEKMRLDASGQLLVNTTTASGRLTVAVAAPATLAAADDGVFVVNGTSRIQMTATGSTFSYMGIAPSAGLLYSVNQLSLAADGGQPISFHTGSVKKWEINGPGHLLAGTDNSFDIGASGATRPRNVYVGTDVFASGNVYTTRIIASNAYTNTQDATLTASGNIPGISLRQNASGRFSAFLNFAAADTLSWVIGTGTGNPATESFRLNLSNGNASFLTGNVGIGTVSPGAKLHVVGSVYLNNGNVVLDDGYALRWGNTYTYGYNAGFMAFVTNNVERARLDASGNLGLGVTPSAWASTFKALQVGSGGAIGDNGVGGYTSFSNNVAFAVDNISTGARYIYTGAAAQYYQFAGAHIWRTAASGTAGTAISFTQAMTLDASGNLGIGITSPSQALQIARGAGVNAYAFFAGGGRVPNAAMLVGQGAGGDGYVWNQDAKEIQFGTNNTIRWSFNASGHFLAGTDNSYDIGASGATRPRNVYVGTDVVVGTQTLVTTNSRVGIGTANPTARVQIVGLGATPAQMFIGDAAGAHYFDASYNVFRLANTVETMRIDPSGNVGIGTSAPNFRLESSAAASGGIATTIRATNSAAASVSVGQGSQIGFANDSGWGTSLAGSIRSTITNTFNGASALSFHSWNGTALTEYARIDSSGNFGLGITPSAWNSVTRALQIGDAGAGMWVYRLAGTSQQYMSIVNNSFVNASGQDIYVRSNPAVQYMQLDGAHRWFNAPSGTAGNAITFTEAMRLDASGNLGLGVTPSAWTSSRKAVQVLNASFHANSSTAYVGYNVYNDGVDKYIATGNATDYYQQAGAHAWRTAASGTAGNAITFTQAMTLDASGNLGLGTASPTQRLHVVGAAYIAGVTQSVLTNGSLQLREAGNSSANNAVEVHIRPLSGKSGYLTFTEDSVADRWGVGIANGNAALLFRQGGFGGTTVWQMSGSGHLLTGADNSYDIGASGATRPRNVYVGTRVFTNGLTVTGAGAVATLDSGAASDARIELAYNGTTQGNIAVDSGLISVRASSGNYLSLGAGNTERARVKAAGQMRFVPLSADPAGPEAGDVYYNSTSNKLKVYDGTSWVDLH